MAIIKCKMCGGDLRIEEGTTVCECEYCGTRQTVPSADNEKKLTLFSRASRLLRGCEFDKAAGVFETIVADFPQEAEAYWGLVLCKYGIEYVDDPTTGKKVPTCHRSSFESVLDDPNFEQACENTDAVARRVYRDEARQIEDLRQAILQVSGREEPYDVFISYKETDENGDRTLDSVIAQDIYKELTGEGYRVFFSRISLEDKLGTEYEPYIFAALNSAKVMLVVGTDYENFDSVWVKNEWSRFLKLIAAGQKKTLIPVFKNMDAYDMPKEFAKLAAQDMGKVGAMQDLVRGVEKLVGKKKAETGKETVVVQQGEGSMKTAAAVKRGYLALEEGEFDAAKEFFNQALTLDAECAEAYLGLALANERCRDEQAYITRACGIKGNQEMLSISPDVEREENAIAGNELKNFLTAETIRNCFTFDLHYLSTAKGQAQVAAQEKKRFENNRYLNRAFRFAKGEMTERLSVFKTKLYAGLDENVLRAKEQAEAARSAKAVAYEKHLAAADEKAVELRREAETRREALYQTACKAQDSADSISRYQRAIEDFRKIVDYKDSSERIAQCQASIRELQKQERLRKEAEEKAAAERAENEAEAAAEEAEHQRILAEKAAAEKKAKQKKIGIIVGTVVAVAIAAILIVTKVIIPGNQYKAAEALFEAGQYEEAIAAFEAMHGYKDSESKISEVQSTILARDYAAAEELLKAGKYEEAIEAFKKLNDYENSAANIEEAKSAILEARYLSAEALLNAGQFDSASAAFCSLENYKDSEEQAMKAQYAKAEALLANGDKVHAAMSFFAVTDYKDAKQRSFELWDQVAQRQSIAAGAEHTVVLKTDGTVAAKGAKWSGRCSVDEWQDIVAVDAAYEHTVGLKSDGTVVAVGANHYGQCDINDWKNIVAISTNRFHTVGLKADGTVIAVGFKELRGRGACDVSAWRDIVAISAGSGCTVGLKADGTVLAAGEKSYQEGVSAWTDIVAISAGGSNIVGLREDGTVVACGSNRFGQCEVSGWTDIVAVSAGEGYTVGLRADGTVVATEHTDNMIYYGQCEVGSWHSIVAVSAGDYHTIGLRSNGTAIATNYTGPMYQGQCDVSDWTDINLPDT